MRMNLIENKAASELKRLLAAHSISPTALAINVGILPSRVSEILNQKRRITADSDLRLCHFFKLKNGFFLKNQIEYDLLTANEKIGKRVKEFANIDTIIHKF